MPRRSTETDNHHRPALLQLVTAVVLLAVLVLGAGAAAIFLAFPCPCIGRYPALNRTRQQELPPAPPNAENVTP